MNEDTIVVMHKTGGFAGMHFAYEQKVQDMAPKLRNKLAVLLDECGILEIDEIQEKNKSARDVFLYKFVVTTSGKSHTAIFDDVTISGEYRALADFLKENALEKE